MEHQLLKVDSDLIIKRLLVHLKEVIDVLSVLLDLSPFFCRLEEVSGFHILEIGFLTFQQFELGLILLSSLALDSVMVVFDEVVEVDSTQNVSIHLQPVE